MSRSVTHSHRAMAAHISSLVASRLLVGDPLFDLDRIEAAASAPRIAGFDRYREGLVSNPQLVQAGHALHAKHFDYFGVADQSGAFSLHGYFLALLASTLDATFVPSHVSRHAFRP